MAFPPQGTGSNDVFYLSGPFNTLHDGYVYLDGSGGFDAISLSGGATILDYAWGGVSNFEDLILGSGIWALSLGGAAANAFTGMHVVIDAGTASRINVDGSGLSAGATMQVIGSASADTVIGSSGTNVFDAHGGGDLLVGGASGDFFYLADHGELAGDTLDGGAGIDTLVMKGGQRINDVDFLHVSHMEALNLQGGGAQIVILAATASAAFDGAVTLGAANAHGLYLDASAFTPTLHVTATAFSDSFVFGQYGGDNVIYNFTTHGHANADQVQLLGHSLAEVQAMLASAVDAGNGTYLYHDGHALVFSGVAKAALSTADFIIA
jgi:hypothetical protein